ncbi:uncharacterized protein G2W53_016133 [Senna tora]|uniref:Uncharacterized protein n=1 Tax=Senna tora TaxID=362788 RepID=A0A834WWU2_9FABA|nr:uncharacterized protein G2W53_016133 [Senna tora]
MGIVVLKKVTMCFCDIGNPNSIF